MPGRRALASVLLLIGFCVAVVVFQQAEYVGERFEEVRTELAVGGGALGGGRLWLYRETVLHMFSRPFELLTGYGMSTWTYKMMLVTGYGILAIVLVLQALSVLLGAGAVKMSAGLATTDGVDGWRAWFAGDLVAAWDVLALLKVRRRRLFGGTHRA